MKKFEYKQLPKLFPGLSLEEQNELGNEGWSICDSEPLYDSQGSIVGRILTFNREIEIKTEPEPIKNGKLIITGVIEYGKNNTSYNPFDPSNKFFTSIIDITCEPEKINEVHKEYQDAFNFLMVFGNPEKDFLSFIPESEAEQLCGKNNEGWKFVNPIFIDWYIYQCSKFSILFSQISNIGFRRLTSVDLIFD